MNKPDVKVPKDPSKAPPERKDSEDSKEEREKQREKDSKVAMFILHYSDNLIAIENKRKNEKILTIDRKSLKVDFVSKDLWGKSDKFSRISIYAIWGKVEIKGVEFLVLVSKAAEAAKINGCDIFEVISVKFVTLSKEKFKNFEHEQCWEELKRTKKFLKTGFYFSYSYDLANSFDNSGAKHFDTISKSIANNVFAWNYKSLKQLTHETKEDDGFFVPIIQGFIGQCDFEQYHFALISRRSFFMGGTRFNSRGTDNHGHVANFVETEFVLTTKNSIFSMKQIRGSLPFYWEQLKGITANVQIHQTEEINTDVLMKHFKFLRDQDYFPVTVFNLLSTKRPEESNLTTYLKALLILSSKKDPDLKIGYEYLDFHAVTKETDFSPVDADIVRVVDEYNVNFNEWGTDLLSGGMTKISSQTGIIRTNCLDCLDRTNAVQTKIAFYTLAKILKKLNSPLITEISPKVLNLFEKGDHPTFKNLRTIWADNGDMISLIYAGTGATTSSVTRNGEKSNLGSIFDHGLKTISRFYLNNFDDDYKQEVIDALLAKSNSSTRHSLLQTSNPLAKSELKLALVSMTSSKNNNNLGVGQNFVSDLFANLQESTVIIFCAYVSNDKPIVLDGPDHLVFPTFTQLFKTFSTEFGDFVLAREFLCAKFECLVFLSKSKMANLSFFKSEPIKTSMITKPYGCRLSLIINDISFELFPIKIESGFFSKTPTDTIKGLLEYYIDRQYDYVVFMGPMENGIEVENLHKNYAPLVEVAVENKKDPTRLNKVYLLVSNSMVSKTKYVPIDYQGLDIGSDLTINSQLFMVAK